MLWNAGRTSAMLVTLIVGSFGLVGCQTSSDVVSRRLIAHRAMIDLHGLKPLQTYAPVDAQAAVPETWQEMKLKQTALYTDMHWKSPSGMTGLGVAQINMPLPLSNKMLIWFAKREYSKRYDDAKVVNQWTDDAGREWFEAESSSYHVRGCAVTRGFQGWIIYFGYRMERIPDANELNLATRAIQTIVPTPFAQPPTNATAAAQ